MVKVFYNGNDVFSGIAATPFIGVEDQFINYKDRFGAIKNITLQGNLTGRCATINKMVSGQNILLDRFSKDFKTFEIKEDNLSIYKYDYAKINSINFNESTYIDILPFTINLSVYPNDLFTGTYGIIDPVNSVNYTESKEGIISVKRTVSAKGLNTNSSSSNSLSNAISYVQSLTGQSMISPAFITAPSISLQPRNISETINRLESTYSVEIDYIYRKNATANTVLSYSIDIGYSEEQGIYDVSLKGNLSGPIGYSISSLRNDFNNFKNSIFSLSLSKFKEITNTSYLNSFPLNFNINENELENTIEFSYSYNSDPYTTKFDYSPTFSFDYSKDLYELTIDGKLTTRDEQAQKMTVLEDALSKINIDNLAQNFYSTIGNVGSSAPLNLNEKSIQIKRNKTQPEIGITAQYDNSPIPPSPFTNFKYTISVDRSFYVFNPIQFLNGDNGAFKLNFYRRGSISIKGSATANVGGLSSIARSNAINLLNLNASFIGAQKRVRTEDNVVESLQSDEQGFVYSFNLTDTCETNIVT